MYKWKDSLVFCKTEHALPQSFDIFQSLEYFEEICFCEFFVSFVLNAFKS